MQHSPTDGVITAAEFEQFRRFIFERAGITLSDAKQRLVTGRLAKRLRHFGISRYGDYFERMMRGELGGDELQVVVDLLTTNETHFFREPAHFDFLRQTVLPQVRSGCTFRVWSAASSTGEEAYSTAMCCADLLGDGPWEVFGSDINTQVLNKARNGHYSMDVAHEIPKEYLRAYCLKGKGSQEGTFLIGPELRRRVRFNQVNLNAPLPDLGAFDLIFLRNVMIYFSLETKRSVVARMLPLLKPGGYFVVGHSESLNGVTSRLQLLRSTIYRKPLDD
ncbi:CheR family methyltransferase [Motiliproteus sediminis]|uniref:CheR family methyltransferase n=1 Tax=Motiliproteus sediminis TaxID=1468178 RepID=UPI001AEFAB79|nr:protein-glutamate O-methyltransferase CheR [Motiliproteus sediminis]